MRGGRKQAYNDSPSGPKAPFATLDYKNGTRSMGLQGGAPGWAAQMMPKANSIMDGPVGTVSAPLVRGRGGGPGRGGIANRPNSQQVNAVPSRSRSRPGSNQQNSNGVAEIFGWNPTGRSPSPSSAEHEHKNQSGRPLSGNFQERMEERQTVGNPNLKVKAKKGLPPPHSKYQQAEPPEARNSPPAQYGRRRSNSAPRRPLQLDINTSMLVQEEETLAFGVTSMPLPSTTSPSHHVREEHLSLSGRSPYGAPQGQSAGTPGSQSPMNVGQPILEVGTAEDPNPRFRPTMEDEHISIQPFAPQTCPGLSHKDNSGYFAVYDGHGGREAVDYIKMHLHRNLDKSLGAHATVQAALKSAFVQTDEEMAGNPRYYQCGSTVCSILIRPETEGRRVLYAANAGDARAVLATASGPNGELVAHRLTKDHTPTTPREIERIRRTGGHVVNGRVNGTLAVSRAMGDHALKTAGVTSVPHQTVTELGAQHKFVIIACDGLWDVITDTEAVRMVAKIRDPERMAKKLVGCAMARCTTDNVSVMCVRLQANI